MKIQIKNRWSGHTVFETDAESLGHAVLAAIVAKADLRDADLRNADLRNADLCDANLRNADLCDANLRDANLRNADLCDADLRNANLRNADLCDANLRNANLRNADLCDANLCDANLCDANLRNADLCDADLRNADLRNADLRDANLCDANLCDANLSLLLSQRTIVADGDIVGWKKLSNGTICKLRIPAAANRIGGLVGRKCRAEFAEVIEGGGRTGAHGPATVYKPGETVKPDRYDSNPLVECSHGIHFFITRAEAERY